MKERKTRVYKAWEMRESKLVSRKENISVNCDHIWDGEFILFVGFYFLGESKERQKNREVECKNEKKGFL
jgi:hypothetical protein